MAIALGRTIGSPVFVFFQIIHGVCLFFVMLGVSRVLLGVVELSASGTASASAASSSSTTTVMPTAGTATSGTTAVPAFFSSSATVLFVPFSVQLSHCFHVPVKSLFNSPVDVPRSDLTAGPHAVPNTGGKSTVESVPPLLRYDGSHTRFYVQHVFAALLCAYPLALLLQRRKLVLDFVITIYVAYWFCTNVVLQAVLGGGTLHWWLACLAGMATMYSATYAVCRRKEMQEVKLSSGANGAAPFAVSASTTWPRDSRSTANLNGDEREMEDVRSVFQDGAKGGSSSASAASPVVMVGGGGGASGHPDKSGGSRGRASVGVGSPKPAGADGCLVAPTTRH